MSGGHFNYIENNISETIFDWNVEIPRYHDGDYEDDYLRNYKLAVKQNPFHDIELSGLMFDLLYMIHILDFYESGDIGEDTYREEVKWFKNKWLKGKVTDRIRTLAEILYENAKVQIEYTISNYENNNDKKNQSG